MISNLGKAAPSSIGQACTAFLKMVKKKSIHKCNNNILGNYLIETENSIAKIEGKNCGPRSPLNQWPRFDDS